MIFDIVLKMVKHFLLTWIFSLYLKSFINVWFYSLSTLFEGKGKHFIESSRIEWTELHLEISTFPNWFGQLFAIKVSEKTNRTTQKLQNMATNVARKSKNIYNERRKQLRWCMDFSFIFHGLLLHFKAFLNQKSKIGSNLYTLPSLSCIRKSKFVKRQFHGIRIKRRRRRRK